MPDTSMEAIIKSMGTMSIINSTCRPGEKGTYAIEELCCENCQDPAVLVKWMHVSFQEMHITRAVWYTPTYYGGRIELSKMKLCLFFVTLSAAQEATLFVLDLASGSKSSARIGRCFFSDGREIHYSSDDETLHESYRHYYSSAYRAGQETLEWLS